MSGCALKYVNVINNFVAKHQELRHLELFPEDWAAIQLVYEWLQSFRQATVQMSTTKTPMLSQVAIFSGLQNELRDALRTLPDNTPPKLWKGLVNPHHKLSNYFFETNESPFYVWAACEFISMIECIFYLLNHI
jgi:hypothetical protein